MKAATDATAAITVLANKITFFNRLLRFSFSKYSIIFAASLLVACMIASYNSESIFMMILPFVILGCGNSLCIKYKPEKTKGQEGPPKKEVR